MSTERHAQFHHQLVSHFASSDNALATLLGGNETEVLKIASRCLGKTPATELRISFRKLPPGILFTMKSGSPAELFFISTAGDAPRFFSCSEDWKIQGNITIWNLDELLPDRIRRTLGPLQKPTALQFCSAIRNLLAGGKRHVNMPDRFS
jgi:hypothetical protein